jgi:capsular polysaccharide biosynthesis protein/MinD-like ATPase involved in chromosome partitioning or flagellar assembly
VAGRATRRSRGAVARARAGTEAAPYRVRASLGEAAWVEPPPKTAGLPLYLQLARAHIWLIVIVVGASVAAAALAVSSLEKTYRAEVDLLVTPIPRNNTNLFGFGLVSESGDPTRDVETVAKLLTTSAVARRVDRRLTLPETPGELLRRVSAKPVAQSQIVTISADAPSGQRAAALANAFGRAAIDERTARLHNLLDAAIPRLRQQLAQLGRREADARAALSTRLQDLETLRVLDDPTLYFQTRATIPTEATSPRPLLSVIAAFLGSSILVFGWIVGSHLVAPRIYGDDDLRRYRLPILGRIPAQRPWDRFTRRRVHLFRAPTADAFHRLTRTLAEREGPGRQSVFLTSTRSSDEKTMVAINLASTLATTGMDVILVDGDPVEAVLSRSLEHEPVVGMGRVVNDGLLLSEALTRPDELRGVRVLPQELDLPAPPDLTRESVDALLSETERLAEAVIVDGPVLDEMSDAVPLAERVGTVLVVVRRNRTRDAELTRLVNQLVADTIVPDGFVVVE